MNGITSAIGNIFNGGSTFGSPLFGSIAIGRKKRSNSEEISNNLQIIRERLIRTGNFLVLLKIQILLNRRSLGGFT